MGLAEMCSATNDIAGAIVNWTSTARDLPLHPGVLNSFGLALEARGRMVAAERVFQRALSILPLIPVHAWAHNVSVAQELQTALSLNLARVTCAQGSSRCAEGVAIFSSVSNILSSLSILSPLNFPACLAGTPPLPSLKSVAKRLGLSREPVAHCFDKNIVRTVTMVAPAAATFSPRPANLTATWRVLAAAYLQQQNIAAALHCCCNALVAVAEANDASSSVDDASPPSTVMTVVATLVQQRREILVNILQILWSSGRSEEALAMGAYIEAEASDDVYVVGAVAAMTLVRRAPLASQSSALAYLLLFVFLQ